MAKTFVPTLVYYLRRVCVYIARYRTTIVKSLPEGAENALSGILIACEIFLDLTDEVDVE
jgi:hypothetical protein